MSRYYRIVNWGEHQHYKDRSPAWIKLHRKLLSSRTWVSASDRTRTLAIACMLIASDTDNQIPDDPAYIKRVAYLNDDPDFDALVNVGFLEIIEETAPRKRSASKVAQSVPNAIPEKRREETETEKRERRGADAPPPSQSGYSEDFEAFWKAYPKTKSPKLPAFVAWQQAIKVADVETLMAACKRYAVASAKPNADFPCHVATWLDERRWEVWGAETATTGATVIDLAEAAERERKLHEEALQKLAKGFTWPTFLGPAPGERDCRIAPDLLTKYAHVWKKPDDDGNHFEIPRHLIRPMTV